MTGSKRVFEAAAQAGAGDMGMSAPVMDSGRIRRELGWEPRRTTDEELLELIDGMRERGGAPTPPLEPGAGGPLRLREFATGVGARS